MTVILLLSHLSLTEQNKLKIRVTGSLLSKISAVLETPGKCADICIQRLFKCKQMNHAYTCRLGLNALSAGNNSAV